jgi:hypothetical protein
LLDYLHQRRQSLLRDVASLLRLPLGLLRQRLHLLHLVGRHPDLLLLKLLGDALPVKAKRTSPNIRRGPFYAQMRRVVLIAFGIPFPMETHARTVSV